MNVDALKTLLESIRDGKISVEETSLKDLSGITGWLSGDNLLLRRDPGAGKKDYLHGTIEKEANILATRARKELFLEVNKLYPDAVYHPLARAITIKK